MLTALTDCDFGDALKKPSPLAGGPLLNAVAAAALLLCHAQASAFSLGRMTVQSALGENLRAEIEISNLTADEAATLHSAIAAPDAFRAAGVDFNSALVGAQATLQRRSDGKAVIRITGDRAVGEPFVDVIMDFSWSGGKLQRAYTLLIDPPTTKTSPTPAPQAAPVFSSPSASNARQAQAAQPAPAQASKPTEPKPVASKPATPASSAHGGETDGSYKVRPGDTLYSIASRHGQTGVSLEQMLVSLYRGNPNAFFGNNMNRMKAGAVLSMPDAQAAGSVSQDEARRVIRAQSADFSGFRQRLAENATSVKGAEAPRQTGGKVEAAVQDRKAATTATPDQLTLSRSTVKPGAEAKVSKETERKAAEARVAELSRNVEELKRLSAGSAASVAAPTKASAPGVKLPVAAAVPVAPQASEPAKSAEVSASVPQEPVPPTTSASAPTAAASDVASAAEPASVASKPRKRIPMPPPTPHEEPGFFDSLFSNPLVVPGGIAVLAALVGLGVMRMRRRKSDGSGETSFMESRIQQDSFFGVSGGQRVDTRDAGASSSSSLSYSLSQLDAIGDVDPVAEADVYLAYGRDLQAEEILKEALRTDPGRVAIRTKLLEVYAKRADPKNFEIQARQVQEMTGGVGEEWDKAKELGRQIDPGNALYSEGVPMTEVDIDTSSEPPPDLRGDADERPQNSASSHSDADMDLDIDLASASSLAGLENTRPLTTTAEVPDLSGKKGNGSPEAPALPDMGELHSYDEEKTVSPASSLAHPKDASDSGSIDFDFGELSLDLGSNDAGGKSSGGLDEVTTKSPGMPDLDLGEEIPQPVTNTEDDFTDSISLDLETENLDPLQRKIELADEFRRIGDVEGARDLLEEVVSKASEPLKTRAQTMLDELG
jgi:pilus assembly protein FimV